MHVAYADLLGMIQSDLTYEEFEIWWMPVCRFGCVNINVAY